MLFRSDESEENENYYSRILKENAEEYQKMINDYSDGEVDVSES